MENNSKWIVYCTTCNINKKIYIGVHKTNPDIFDGYLGCGANINKPSSYNKGKTHLHNAILKYGTSAFYRQTIKEFFKDGSCRNNQPIITSLEPATLLATSPEERPS